MKIVFLDIDGVLAPHKKSIKQHDYFPVNVEFSPTAVKNLKKILKKSQAKLVLSSKWVDKLGLTTVLTTLASHGILGPYVVYQDVETNIADFVKPNDWLADKGNFYGITSTPKKFSSDKCHEISFWLSEYAAQIKGYVVIDDDFIAGQEDYQVQTDGKQGLTEENVDQALNILNSGLENYYKKIKVQKARTT